MGALATTASRPGAACVEVEIRVPFERTLEDVIAAAWSDLGTDGRTECPVCGGQMRTTPARTAAACEDCGAELT